MASPAPVARVVEGFLKDLLGAKKAVRLYPAGNPLASEWMSRLHRSLETALKDGLPPVLRIAPGRFEWDGGQLVTKDQALESFRFELETRRITEMAIDPGVEPWELQHFLDCLASGESPRTDGRAGLGVVQVLEALQTSLDSGGAPQPVGAAVGA